MGLTNQQVDALVADVITIVDTACRHAKAIGNNHERSADLYQRIVNRAGAGIVLRLTQELERQGMLTGFRRPPNRTAEGVVELAAHRRRRRKGIS